MVEYLSGGRIQGTDSTTRLKNLFPDAFTGVNHDGNTTSMAGAGAGGTKTDTPIYGQNSLYFDPQDKVASGTNFTTYIGGIGSTTKWQDLPKEDFTVTMWLKYDTTLSGEAGHESSLFNYGDIIGNSKAWESDTMRRGNGFAIGIKADSSEKFFIHLASNGNEDGIALNKYYSGGADALRDDKWHFYVFTFNNTGSLLSIYRDAAGTAIDTQAYANNPSGTMTTSTATFDVGRHGAGNGNGLRQVYVCDVSIWGRILTSAEITTIYGTHDPDTTADASNTGKNISDSGIDTTKCYVWWKMGDFVNGTDGFSTSAVASTQVPITDVPLGTRLEVTDTRKIYRFNPSSQGTNLNEDDNMTFNANVGYAGYGYEFASDHAIVGNSVTSVWFKMKRNGTQSAGVLSVYAGQSASTGNNTLIAHVNASALPTDYEWVEFTGTPYTLLANDKIWIKVSTQCTTTNSLRHFSNAAGGYSPAPAYDYWGAETPTEGETLLGTHDLGGTFSLFKPDNVTSAADVPPPRDDAATGHPAIIKIDYAKARWTERGTAE